MELTTDDLESILDVVTHKINAMHWQQDAMRMTFTKADEDDLEKMIKLQKKLLDSGFVKQKELKEDGNLLSASYENLFD